MALSKSLARQSAAEITQLSDRDHVRKRKGMYLPNINYMVYEIVDNSIDENMAGYATAIYVGIKNGEIIVQDDGRGIPIAPSKDNPEISQAEVAYTSLKAGGKFGLEDGYNDVKTGGLNGVGASAVNFLSEYCLLRITIDGIEYGLDFAQGVTSENGLYEIGPVGEEYTQHGTLVQLKPDEEMWEEEKLDIDEIVSRMEQLTFLNPGLTIIVDIDQDGRVINETFYNPEGSKAYIEKLSKEKELITDIWQLDTTVDGIDVSIALAYEDDYKEKLYGFTNNIPNPMGGDHMTGFRMGLFKAISEYYDENSQNKTKADVISDDVKEGLVAIVNIKVANPNFEGQGKAKLNMIKVRSSIRKLTEEFVEEMLDKNPDQAKIIVAKMVDACKARESAKRARDTARKSKSVDAGKAAKLADCKYKDPEVCEIFLVEGDSAAGTAKDGRDRNIQAILPVFGKIQNAEKSTLEKVIDSEKIKELLRALKCGIAEDFDIDKLKYHKIIIMADADVDGSHIQCLYVPLFYRFLRPIIEQGMLYFACPPLFKIEKGKNVLKYAYSDEERDRMLAELGEGTVVSRYKGLGEMNAEELWETTMNPENRRLVQVVIDDIEKDEEMIATLMGEFVAPRRAFIMENAANVELMD